MNQQFIHEANSKVEVLDIFWI